jgi:hypothetical protein
LDDDRDYGQSAADTANLVLGKPGRLRAGAHSDYGANQPKYPPATAGGHLREKK